MEELSLDHAYVVIHCTINYLDEIGLVRRFLTFEHSVDDTILLLMVAILVLGYVSESILDFVL